MPIAANQRLLIAYQALQNYDVSPTMVTFLQHSENVTFHIACRTSAFLLRLHSPRFESFVPQSTNPQMVCSEMLWLKALHGEGLPVPEPIANKAGEYVSPVARVNATLLRWQEGELMRRDLENEETAAQMGRLVGKLHAHASQWQFPVEFLRPERDSAYFQNALQALRPAIQDGRISFADYQTLETALFLLNEQTYRLERTPQTWGLLHADLHRGNFLLHEGQIRLIDFSMCAFGHFAYDLATCLSNVRTAYHPIFLNEYVQFMPLPPDYERLLEGYFIASYIATLALWVSDPQGQETFIQRAAYVAREYATRFNHDERFWFG
ncbi:MAG: hypothetical protein DDG60_06960 [Anaerolineae bacterium]|nr:MAG: hypothetical protein DDG60_06960 [Anaerolineae bacterium]